MKAVFRLGKLAHPLMKLLGFQSLVITVKAIGTDRRFFYPLSGINMGSIGPLFHSLTWALADQAPYRLRELINKNDFGFLIDLQRVYQFALNSTLIKLKEKSLLEQQDIEPVRIETFFEDLKTDYYQQEKIYHPDWNEIIDAFAYNRKNVPELVANTLQLDLALPEFKILCLLIDRFPEEMEQGFLEELLKPELDFANLYFTFYVIESYLQNEYNSQKIILQETSCLLEKVIVLSEVGQSHREEAQRLLQSVKEILLKKEENSEEFNQKFTYSENEASSPLPLYLPGENTKHSSLFHWQESTPSFVGRESELKDLHKFVCIADRAFQWGGILGPPGIGKSRLVVEFCKQIRKLGFTAGFLRAEHLHLLVDYQPDSPTLVVIDGLATIYMQVIEVIEHLYQRRNKNPLANNLRVLFLERNRYDIWWKYLNDNPQVSHSLNNVSFCLRAEFPLFKLDEKEIWHIVKEVYQKRKKDNIPYSSEQVINQVNRLDSESRPQVAILVGLMVADGHFTNLNQWDLAQLLRIFLNHKNNEFWQTLAVSSKDKLITYEGLLVLITIAQGLPEDTVTGLCKKNIGKGGHFPQKPDRAIYLQLATGRVDTESGKYIWEGLPTDLVGEFYVLNQLEKWLKGTEGQNKAKETIERLIQTAWEIRPAETRDFINKVVKDFPELVNSEAYQLLLYTSPAAHSSKRVWTERARLFINLISVIYSQDELPVFVRYFEALQNEIRLINEEAIKEFISLYKARISCSLHSYFLCFEDEVQAKNYYQHTAALLDRFITADFGYWQAQVEDNYIEYFIRKNQLQPAEQCYGHIKALQKAYRDSEKAWVQAKAAYKLIEYFIGHDISIENYESAGQYYKQIETLQEDFPHVVIALVQAKTAHRLAIYSLYRKKGEQAVYYFSQITGLNTRYQDYKLVKEEYKLIRELIRYNQRNENGKEKNPEAKRKYYRRMIDLEKMMKNFL